MRKKIKCYKKMRNGLWLSRGRWTPVYYVDQQKQAGEAYQTYALDAGGKVVWAGVTRHEHMNRAIARQIQRVWARWRKEYDAQPENVTSDYPAKHVMPVTRLVVFPVDRPERREVFAV